MVYGTYYIFTSELQPFADYFFRQRGKREPVKSLWFSAYWRIDHRIVTYVSDNEDTRLHAFFMLVCYLDVKRRWKGVGRLPGLSAEVILKQEVSS